jgi:hypothetical protein
MKKKYKLSYTEVSKVLGISRQRVAQIINELEGKCRFCNNIATSPGLCDKHFQIRHDQPRRGEKRKPYSECKYRINWRLRTKIAELIK